MKRPTILLTLLLVCVTASCDRRSADKEIVFPTDPEGDYRIAGPTQTSPDPSSPRAALPGRIPPPPLPGNAPFYDPKAGERPEKSRPLEEIFGATDKTALLDWAPEMIEIIFGREKSRETAAAVGTLLDEIGRHPLGAHAPEILDSLLKNDGKLPPEMVNQAPALIEGILQEATRDHPEAAALWQFIFRILRESK